MSTLDPVDLSSRRLVGRDVRRVVDDEEDEVFVSGVGQAVLSVRGHLDEGAGRDVPTLTADPHASGARQEDLSLPAKGLEAALLGDQTLVAVVSADSELASKEAAPDWE